MCKKYQNLIEKSGKQFVIKCQAITFHMFFSELNCLFQFLSNAVVKCYSRDGSYCIFLERKHTYPTCKYLPKWQLVKQMVLKIAHRTKRFFFLAFNEAFPATVWLQLLSTFISKHAQEFVCLFVCFYCWNQTG